MPLEETVWGLRDQGKTRQAAEAAVQGAVDALLMAAGVEVSCHEDPAAAVKLLEIVVALAPANWPALGTLCSLAMQRRDAGAAVRWGERLVAVCQTPDAYYNYGLALMHAGRYPEAADVLRKVIALEPEAVLAHCHLANVLLATGEFEAGLREDEWRFRLPAAKHKKVWDGRTPLAGKRVLVFNEQGAGDLINFVRYVPHLKALGCYVLLEAGDLTPLLYWAAGVDQLVVPPVEYDVAVSVNSLPRHFDPRLDAIPMSVPYLRPDLAGTCPAEEFVKELKGFKIVAVYAGSGLHTNDAVRSCPLRYFQPVADLPGVTFITAQTDVGPRAWADGSLFETGDVEVVDLAAGCEDMAVYDAGPLIRNYNDTARVLLAADLVVSVDTSTAHLAGALGRPVWLLLPHSHEWRWQKQWYPTMRVFRQQYPGDWAGLLKTVAQEVKSVNIHF